MISSICHVLQVLGEVLQPGDRVLVAKGGKGGMGIKAPSKIQKQKELRKELKTAAVGCYSSCL